jgi:microcystin-dependent protein
MGETAGTENVGLNAATVPPHTHTLSATPAPGTKNTLTANLVPADGTQGGGGGGGKHPVNLYAQASAGPQVTLAPVAISTAGGNIPHNNMQPTLTANWCIALQGIYPTRG